MLQTTAAQACQFNLSLLNANELLVASQCQPGIRFDVGKAGEDAEAFISS